MTETFDFAAAEAAAPEEPDLDEQTAEAVPVPDAEIPEPNLTDTPEEG